MGGHPRGSFAAVRLDSVVQGEDLTVSLEAPASLFTLKC